MLQGPAYASHTHSPPTKPLRESSASRHALQQTLQRELQTLQERENQTQKASQKARLSARQANLLKTHQTQLTAELKRTQKTLTQLNARIAQLDTQEEHFSQDQQKQQQNILSLLPLLLTLRESPGHSLVASSPLTSSEPAPDPSMTLPLLHARLVMTHQEITHLQQQRDALHQNQTQLDLHAQRIQSQQRQQKKRHLMSQEEALKARDAQQKAQQKLAQSRALLRQSHASMHSLSVAIDQLTRQEQLARRHLQKKARLLRKTHHKAQAHQTEITLHTLDNGPGLAHGQGTTPVHGEIITRWKQPTEAGPATGITYRASASATVYAPCSGRVLFTGEFRSFGPMIILDCGHSQRFVLAGLGSITTSTNRLVKRQAPLGTMPPQGGSLFVQLRRGNTIANPLPFLSATP